ncbi:peroxiredoxin family protein [Sulfurospirillum arsenophilum]|uniref:peroxiredoxin family protein n=1 Tax=Sulfurospirillum arsenophilum TaxID=56698 RepID=UPI0005AB2729|nr:TlpA disulfide reductase family protein [Sulfurospirillum arsenophilum]
MRKSVLTLLLFALLFNACSAVPQKAKMNAQAPELSAKTLSGDPVTLSNYAGKVIVLRFWMMGCASCTEAMPLLDQLQEQYPDKLAIIAVNSLNENKDIAAFEAQSKFHYPLLKDDIDITAKRYNVRSVPIMFLIDNQGVLKEVIHGELPWKEAQKIIMKYL